MAQRGNSIKRLRGCSNGVKGQRGCRRRMRVKELNCEEATFSNKFESEWCTNAHEKKGQRNNCNFSNENKQLLKQHQRTGKPQDIKTTGVTALEDKEFTNKSDREQQQRTRKPPQQEKETAPMDSEVATTTKTGDNIMTSANGQGRCRSC